MRYRQLGNSGLTVSELGLGCNNFGRRIGQEATDKVVRASLDAGITLFDTADIYDGDLGDSEEMLGSALQGHRAEVILATKFGGDTGGRVAPEWVARGSRRYIRAAVEQSLRRLGTDWIDLYQLHFPDPHTPMAETLAALDDLVREGKVRYIGSSNLAAWQITDADWIARSAGTTAFVSAQNNYNLLERDVEADVVPACLHAGIGILPYYPLSAGLLTGKFRRDQSPPEGTRIGDSKPELHERADWDTLEALERFAADRGRALLDVALAGLAARPAVASVIAGARTPEQVDANARAIEWELDDDERAALDQVLAGDAAVRFRR